MRACCLLLCGGIPSFALDSLALLAGWVQVAFYEIVAIWISPTPYESSAQQQLLFHQYERV